MTVPRIEGLVAVLFIACAALGVPELAEADIGAFEFSFPPIFADGFETGDTTMWSSST